MSQEIKKTSTALGTVALVLLIAITTGFWLMVFYSDYTVQEGSKEIRIDDYGEYNVTNVVLDYRSKTAPINIYAADPSEEFIFTAQWRHLFSTSFGNENNTPGITVIIEDKMAEDNETLIITINVEADSTEFYSVCGINIWEFDVYVNPAYIINLTADLKTGSLDLYAKEAQFNAISIGQNTGSLDVVLENTVVNNTFLLTSDTGSLNLVIKKSTLNCVLDIKRSTGSVDITVTESSLNDIKTITNTGSIDMSLEAIQLPKDQTISLTADTGSISLSWIQPQNLGYHSTITISTDTGSISAYISASSPSEFTVQASTDTGSKDVEVIQY
jgi:hypothetical protein